MNKGSENMKDKIIKILQNHHLKIDNKKLEKFVSLLKDEDFDDETLEKLVIKNFTIGESYFFRDKKIFDNIKNIFQKKQNWKILSIGCSRGEEVYTLSFIANELNKNVEITGIDLNEERIKQAKEGKYNYWSVRFLDKEQIEKYFIKDGNYYYVKDKYKENVKFISKNILEFTGKKFDMIFLRRVLIYAKNPENIIKKVYDMLFDNGYLVIGLGEYFPELFEWFSPLSPDCSSILVKSKKLEISCNIFNKEIDKKIINTIKHEFKKRNLEDEILIIENLIESKEYEKVYNIVKQLYVKYPLSYIVWKYKAYIEYELGLKELAQKSLKRAILLNNSDDEIWQLKFSIEE